MEQLKIAMFSFADINNYGDILFSHIFRKEISERIPGVEITFFSPSDASVEGINYVSYTKDKVDNKYDSLILAGGEVVHFYDERTWFPIYKKSNLEVSSLKPSDVVWDWADCNSNFKAWFSVGVRPFEDNADINKIDTTIENLDYISVRGILSKKILERKVDYYNPKIDITPDLGWLFPSFLEHSGKMGSYYANIVGHEKYVVFQVNAINSEEAALIAESLMKFEEFSGLKVVLLPVVHPWEDEKYLKIIEESSKGKLKMLPATLSTLEIADVIVHAEVVLCSSLHTAITALAHGVPAAIINKWHGTKLQDLFGLQFRTEYLSSNFNDTYKLLASLLIRKEDQGRSLRLYSEFMQERLKVAFDELCRGILKGNIVPRNNFS